MSPAAGRGRIAGAALLGVAAVALVIGIVMATTGGPSQRTAEQGPKQPGGSPSTSASGSTAPGTAASAPPSSSVASGTAGASASPAKPSAGGSSASEASTTVVPPPPPAGNPRVHQAALPAGVRNVQVRVYNNSTIKGLAARAAEDLRRSGYHVVEVGNYAAGIIPATTAYYRPGTGEKAAAELLGDQYDMRVKPRFPGIQQASPGVIVIVTKNYHSSPVK